MMRNCSWCGLRWDVTQAPNPLVHTLGQSWRCRDTAACAERAGEQSWGNGTTGRYCCLDRSCSHPREQVFNGGGG